MVYNLLDGLYHKKNMERSNKNQTWVKSKPIQGINIIFNSKL